MMPGSADTHDEVTELEEQARSLNVPVEELRKFYGEDRDEGEAFNLLPDNLPPFEAFLRLLSQWRHVAPAMGGMIRTGLDYAAVEAYMRMERVPLKDRAALFADLQTMERAALKEWALVAEKMRVGRG